MIIIPMCYVKVLEYVFLKNVFEGYL